MEDLDAARLNSLEKEFNALKDKYFGDKVKELEKEVEALQSATHQGFLQKCSELDELKSHRLLTADKTKEMQLTNLDHEFEAEKKQADDEYPIMGERSIVNSLDSLHSFASLVMPIVFFSLHRRWRCKEKNTIGITRDVKLCKDSCNQILTDHCYSN
jgi:hypothetical protein